MAPRSRRRTQPAARSPASAAQIAVRVTFVLKGHLKNAQLSYLRAAVLLARVRDERLWSALGHPSIDDYAQTRLGLQRAALYHYLQVHDWVHRRHPEWLRPHPKGFIPELSDVAAIMWIEHRLESDGLGDADRKSLETVRRKAEAGRLTDKEFRAVRAEARDAAASDDGTSFLRALTKLRRQAARQPQLGPHVLAALDATIAAAESALHAGAPVASIKKRRVA